ncbi:MAG: acylphosphatase [Sneathiellaceae bacterium]
MQSVKTVRVVVQGRVQGVGYRDWIRNLAVDRQLTGWVRNNRNGDVELLLHGNAAQVDLVVRELWIGPSSSAVSQVRVEPSLPFDEGGAVDLSNFVRRPDA